MMRTLVAKGLVWAGMLTATVALAGAYMFGVPAKGSACKTTPCTYIDAQGNSHTGKCGSKKDDTKQCYCFDKDDKKLSEVQAVCAVPK